MCLLRWLCRGSEWVDSARGPPFLEWGCCFKETMGVSQPAHFTDMETEVQSLQTHGQVSIALASAVALSPQSIHEAETGVWTIAFWGNSQRRTWGGSACSQMCGAALFPARCAS